MTERSTLDICIAVKEAEDEISDEELRLCVAAMCGIEHFYREALINLIELIREDKPMAMLKMKAEFHWGTVEQMFEGQKKPMTEWLGPGNIPGTPEQQQRLALGKKIFKQATGIDL